MPEVLNRALHTRGYNFIKSPLIINNISNIPGKKGLLFAEGAGHEGRRGVVFRVCKLRGWSPGFDLEGAGMPERAAGAVRRRGWWWRRGSGAHRGHWVLPALPASTNSVP